MSRKIGLYIHFPFCRTKCPYCHFASVPFERGLLDRWRKGLELEATLRASAEFDVETLYIGGGTPSLLNPDDIKMLVEKLGEASGSSRSTTASSASWAGDTRLPKPRLLSGAAARLVSEPSELI